MLERLISDVERQLIERADGAPSPRQLLLNLTEIRDVLRGNLRDLVAYAEHCGGFEEWKKQRCASEPLGPASPAGHVTPAAFPVSPKPRKDPSAPPHK